MEHQLPAKKEQSRILNVQQVKKSSITIRMAAAPGAVDRVWIRSEETPERDHVAIQIRTVS
jgi:hypothetical protein